MDESHVLQLDRERRAWCLLMLCQNDLPARELPLFEGQQVVAMDDRPGGQTMIIVDLGDSQFIHPVQAYYTRCSGSVLDWFVVPSWAAPQVTRTEVWRGGFEPKNYP
jgi:hypothetical protein